MAAAPFDVKYAQHVEMFSVDFEEADVYLLRKGGVISYGMQYFAPVRAFVVNKK